jgi:invasion protein IalB
MPGGGLPLRSRSRASRNRQEPFLVRTLLRRLRLACPVLALLALAAPPAGAADAAAAATPPAPHVIGQFKEWLLVCADIDAKPNTPEQCFLNDAASARDTPPPQVKVALGHAQADGGKRVLAIQFAFRPGSIDREAGFQVSVDKLQVLAGTVAECTEEACLSGVAPVAPQLLDAMKRGTLMVVAYKTEAGGAANDPVSLAGFTAAVNALEARAPGQPAAAVSPQSPRPPGAAAPTATFRDWSLYCADSDKNAATPPTCELSQAVRQKDAARMMMLARIGMSTAEDGGRGLAMMLMFPPQADKDASVGILIDDKQLGSGPIAACNEEFCHTVLVLSTELINLMKQGTKMTVVYTLKGEGKVGVPLSLLGITAAIDALVARS